MKGLSKLIGSERITKLLVNKYGAHTNNNLIYCGVIEPFVWRVHVSVLREREMR